MRAGSLKRKRWLRCVPEVRKHAVRNHRATPDDEGSHRAARHEPRCDAGGRTRPLSFRHGPRRGEGRASARGGGCDGSGGDTASEHGELRGRVNNDGVNRGMVLLQQCTRPAQND